MLDAFANGACDLIVGPSAAAGFRIGCEIGDDEVSGESGKIGRLARRAPFLRSDGRAMLRPISGEWQDSQSRTALTR